MILFRFLYLPQITTLKQDSIAAAFSITSLTELEQNHSSGLLEYDLSLFAETAKYFYFVPMDKTSKKIDRYLGNDYLIGKWHDKGNCTKVAIDDPCQGVFQNFECIIYSDLAFKSAISVSSARNSRSFT